MKNFFLITRIYLSNSFDILFNTFFILVAKLLGNLDSYKDFYCSAIINGFDHDLIPELLEDQKINLEECEDIIYIAILYNTIPLVIFPSIRNEVFDKCSESMIRKFRWKYLSR